MMPRLRLLMLMLAILSASLTVTANQTAPRLMRQTWTIKGVERSAIVVSPQVTQANAPAPLVLIFHGHGGTSMNSARTFAIQDTWPEAVVIYPQGLPTPGLMTDPAGERPGWQQAPSDQKDRDLEFVDAMLAWARSKYTIDPNRVYAGGHSNGGTMTYVLWVTRPDVFAAFAPSASVFRRELIGRAKPKPALIVAGENDQLVPFAAQRASLAATLALNKAEQTSAPWSGPAVLHKSSIGADVVAYIHPGNHTMPADTGAMMAKFFKAYVKAKAD